MSKKRQPSVILRALRGALHRRDILKNECRINGERIHSLLLEYRDVLDEVEETNPDARVNINQLLTLHRLPLAILHLPPGIMKRKLTPNFYADTDFL